MDTHEYAVAPPEGLAERIRNYRLDRDLTQRDLAEQLGVTQQSVARWEQGSPPRRSMLRVLESLLDERGPTGQPAELAELADIIGIHPPVREMPRNRGIEEGRKAYVQGCLKLLERGERLPNRVLLLLADELGWVDDD